MGNSTSKATRKLSKHAELPTWAGKRTPGPSTGVTGKQAGEALASEQKTQGAFVDFFLFLVQPQETQVLACARTLRNRKGCPRSTPLG